MTATRSTRLPYSRAAQEHLANAAAHVDAREDRVAVDACRRGWIPHDDIRVCAQRDRALARRDAERACRSACEQVGQSLERHVASAPLRADERHANVDPEDP